MFPKVAFGFAGAACTLNADYAASCFGSWRGILIKSRRRSRRPIPKGWHVIGVRSSPYHLADNPNAPHPVNAMLNYAYGVLGSEIRMKATSEDYDPTIGIMHEGSNGSSKSIFDLMEPERPKAGWRVPDFIRSHVFDPTDFAIRSDEVCGLSAGMARMVVAIIPTCRS